jgi:acetyltransferase
LPAPTVKPSASPLACQRADRPLEAFFNPTSVAVIGATEALGSVGRTLLENLIGHGSRTIYPVNPRRKTVLDVEAFPNVSALPEAPELAVIATPAKTVPGVVDECVAAGVKAAIIISAGFKECSAEGAALEREVLAAARRGGMRIIGPNCLGLMRPQAGLNASFASHMALSGRVGFLSQSGALCTGVLDWSLQEHIGFSAFVSIGSMLDVGWGDLIDTLGDDPHTDSIVIYMESIGHADDVRAFLSAARHVALTKPIIVLKAGRSAEATKAAASHTGGMTGSDDVLDAAFKRCGVLRVNTIAELFYMAEVLGKQPRPKGNRLAILTNAGGPAVLATDALVSGGGQLAPLLDGTRATLDSVLPSAWSHANPVDVLGDAGPDRYAAALDALHADPTTDGLLVVLTPQAMTDPSQTASEIIRQTKLHSGTCKPILASWMGGADVAIGREILNRAGVPTFPYPDTAASVFNNMWRYSHNLRALYETPTLSASYDKQGAPYLHARIPIEQALAGGRTLLTEAEAKSVLAAYDIPTVRTVAVEASSGEDACVAEAERMGYPVVLKLLSHTITHKTDIGGVKLNLADVEAVRNAYRDIERSVREHSGAEHFQGVTVQPMVSRSGIELILGSAVDPQFGPVILFGAGGIFVELYKDRALGLPPLNTVLARRIIEQTTISEALKGIRGRKAVDMGQLEQILVRFSQLVAEQPRIKEIDVNPLLATEDGLCVLDARIILHSPDVLTADLPRTAIRPYPSHYTREWAMNDGTSVTIRPIKAEDEPRMVQFHKTLSPETVHGRYFGMLSLSARTQHERLVRVCFTDYDREIALVAARSTSDNSDAGNVEILGVGRLVKLQGERVAEFALVVSDPAQGQGLGMELMRRLIEVGRAEGLERIRGEVMAENTRMRQLCAALGFADECHCDDGTVQIELLLS